MSTRLFCRHFGMDRQVLLNADLNSFNHLEFGGVFRELQGICERAAFKKPEKGQIKKNDGGEFSYVVTNSGEHYGIILRDSSEEGMLKQLVNRYISPNLGDLSAEELATFTYPERRNMTVSFTDLRNFTEMSERLSPEEIRSIINTYLDETIRAIDENQSTVDKIIGDEVMALYGAPRYFKDHAFRAIKTCTEQLKNLEEARRAFSGQGRDIPECGIGIHTGDMVLGNIGGGSRQAYTVLGAAVNLGSRLCSSAAPAQILCSESTVMAALNHLPEKWEVVEAEEHVDEFMRTGEVINDKRKVIRVGPKVKDDPRKAVYYFISLPSIKVKGISDPVEIFSLKEGRHRQSVHLKQELVPRENVLRIFGKYNLIKEVGRGGMGVVYEAKDSFANKVAIKTLLAGDGASEAQIKRFSREATIMAQLSHRNLCRIHEVGDVEGTRYIAMEYVEGFSMAEGL